MRQGNPNNKQQQQRMRGRSNNTNSGNVNRKGPNPLSRSYESTGPDVKIRGTALHIAEKYVQLARDAQSSGDRVLAESYLQHAEHYYRIIAAAQAQLQQPITVVRTDIQGDDDDDDDLDTAVDVRATAYAPVDAPQPFIEDAGAEAAVQPERANGERPPQDRDRPMGDRPQRDRFGRERVERGDRFVQDRDQGDRGGDRTLDRDRNGDRDRNVDRNGDRGRMQNGQRGYRDNFRANGGRTGDGRNDMGPSDGNRSQPDGNRFEAPAGEGARADAARLETRVDGRPEYRSERGERFANRGERGDFRGERAPRERPQYRSERADRPERADRFEGERREVRIDVPEVVEERPVVEPVLKSELPAFITGIQPRVEAKAERPTKIERTEEVAVKVAPAPAPEPAAELGEVVVPVKRPRGRPRKVPIVVAPVTASED